MTEVHESDGLMAWEEEERMAYPDLSPKRINQSSVAIFSYFGLTAPSPTTDLTDLHLETSKVRPWRESVVFYRPSMSFFKPIYTAREGQNRNTRRRSLLAA